MTDAPESGGDGGEAGALQIEDAVGGKVTSTDSSAPENLLRGELELSKKEIEMGKDEASDSSEEEAGPVGGAFGLFDNLTSSSDDEEDEEEKC